jgi:hypothetical protein
MPLLVSVTCHLNYYENVIAEFAQGSAEVVLLLLKLPTSLPPSTTPCLLFVVRSEDPSSTSLVQNGLWSLVLRHFRSGVLHTTAIPNSATNGTSFLEASLQELAQVLGTSLNQELLCRLHHLALVEST